MFKWLHIGRFQSTLPPMQRIPTKTKEDLLVEYEKHWMANRVRYIGMSNSSFQSEMGRLSCWYYNSLLSDYLTAKYKAEKQWYF